ncbi:MAG: serine/threonine-protein phosphatase [Candidatus Eremiobacteraeota bacterium]|nr:serine/threonine-protein phosphatase [Candidatus Eremiobacteraeota bacterium]MBC5820429.1 serine/threonine-protein phosphatase [Candidatus Eremiobacteraeota bacterium]
MVTRRTLVTLVLFVGLLAAFAFATYLSYWGGVGIRDAFAYQSAVVAAQRDSELLEVEQFERRSSPEDVRPYEKLLASDLERVDGIAQTDGERAPHFAFPAGRDQYERLTAELLRREALGQQRFDTTVSVNTRTRDLSNGLFAVVALLFALVVGRLRRVVDESRVVVEGLQKAVLSKRRDVPNVDVGSVLLSATQGSNVGGDTYDAFTFDRRHAMFLVADVSGKGLAAAVDTALVKYSIRTLFSEHHDPGEVLARFGALYARSADRPETFVVLFLAVIDLQTGCLRYASAGHEPAWLRRSAAVTQLAPTGPIVGIEDEPQYGTCELMLAEDDLLIVTTDGLTESRDAHRQFLGPQGAANWFTDLDGNAQMMADTIVRRLRHRSRRIADDLAILVVRYAPSARGEAPNRVLETATGSR